MVARADEARMPKPGKHPKGVDVVGYGKLQGRPGLGYSSTILAWIFLPAGCPMGPMTR